MGLIGGESTIRGGSPKSQGPLGGGGGGGGGPGGGGGRGPRGGAALAGGGGAPNRAPPPPPPKIFLGALYPLLGPPFVRPSDFRALSNGVGGSAFRTRRIAAAGGL
jgi:hypothetical protein